MGASGGNRDTGRTNCNCKGLEAETDVQIIVSKEERAWRRIVENCG